ncbi:hypothetical protein E4U24_002353 [Claviceps purpurea]|nr:hypothetical protein E4U24_002353 [Claviceps purpurea]
MNVESTPSSRDTGQNKGLKFALEEGSRVYHFLYLFKTLYINNVACLIIGGISWAFSDLVGGGALCARS